MAHGHRLPYLRVVVALASLLASGASRAADLPSATRLVENSIIYHDPCGHWGREPVALTLEETRPNGHTRTTWIGIDMAHEVFTWSTVRDGHDLSARIEGDSWQATMDGSAEMPAEAVETYGLSEADVKRKRDYYTYLWGLPMKLRDPGTRIDAEVTRTVFWGREVLALRVTYDEDVGGETWYVYFDPETSALVGYRFFHDERASDGEYITLEDEVSVAGMKLPRSRSWYYNKDDEYLGTDTLVGIQSSEP